MSMATYFIHYDRKSKEWLWTLTSYCSRIFTSRRYKSKDSCRANLNKFREYVYHANAANIQYSRLAIQQIDKVYYKKGKLP